MWVEESPMESDRARLERKMLHELQQISSSTDEQAKCLHRQRAEQYRDHLRSLLSSDLLHHKL